MPENRAGSGFHVVLSYGDVFRQSGYRTRVLGELLQYERRGNLKPFLIVFDRDAARISELDLGGVRFRSHQRSSLAVAAMQYHQDLSSLSRESRIGIVHGHNLYSGALALSARWRHGYKVLLDYHGRIPEEYLILGKGGRISYWLLKRLESWVMRSADHIIPVSHKLKDYVTSEYQIDPRKLTVIPDCADPAVFRWDTDTRESTRRRLGLEGKLVCVHLGSFFIWYDPELIVETFTRIRSRIPAAHLLIVTEEAVRATAYLSGTMPQEAVTVISARHEEVPSLLAASDLGFLLLHSTPNINVSSPTKFSEYLNSGLPVLITSQVGDFSAMVTNERVGAVVGDDGSFDMKFVENLMPNRTELAARCTAAGAQLTWQAFSEAWSKLIEQLSSSSKA